MAIKTSSQSLLSRGSTTTAISGFGGGGTTSSDSITINSVVYLAANGTPLIANAAPTTGNSVIKIVGSGFVSTSNVYLNGLLQPSAALNFIDSTEFRLNMPALTSNTYSLMIFNSSTAGAIYYQGVRFDPYPIWSTGSYINTSTSINVQLLVTGYGSGTVTFGLSSGNTLPSGVTLSSSGLLSGTVTQTDQTGIYNFYVDATDSENEITTQQITLTVNINDPYFYLNTTTINFDRTVASTNNFIVRDSSNNNYTLIPSGTLTQSSQNPFGFGTWSMDFTNALAYASVPASANLNVGTANFTVEAWVFPIAFGDVTGYSGSIRGIFSFAALNYFGLNTSGIPVYNGTAFGSTAISTYTWTHIAWSRIGSTLTCYVDGVSRGTQSVSGAIGNSSTINQIGAHGGGNYFYGYISNLRVLNGTGIYTGNFTSPTTALPIVANTQLLVCQASSFRDVSNNAFVVTRSKNAARAAAAVPNIIRFNPFGVSGNSYISSANTLYSGSIDFTFGNFGGGLATANSIISTGVFTWECYAYVPYIPSNIGFLGFNYNSEATYRWGGWITTGGAVQGNLYGTGNQTFAGDGSVITGAWSHYAFARDSGGTIRFFRDGVVQGSAVLGSQLGNGTGITLSGIAVACDIRFYKDRCVYTGAFTPTWQPLDNSNNATVLVKGTNGAVYDHSLMNSYRLVNASANTTVVKNGTASISFTGANSYMNTAVSSSSSGVQSSLNRNFTVEAWVYFNTVSSVQPIMAYGTAGAATQLLFSFNNTLGLRWNYAGATTNINQGSASGWTTGTWYHVAATRVGTQITLWKDGANVASGTASTTYGGLDLYVGGSIGDAVYMNGNIDDFRITNGYARYTTSFAPPIAIFTQ